MSVFSTSTELVDGRVRVTILLSTTAGPVPTSDGPVHEFRPYLDVDLDEAHAIILFGELGLALQALADAPRGNVVPIR